MGTTEHVNESQLPVIEYKLSEIGSIYLDVWKLGVNVALRISDLLNMKYEQVINNQYKLIEGKTGKHRLLTLNKAAMKIINARRELYPNDVYIFQSHSHKLRRGAVQPVNRATVTRVFKRVGDDLNIKLNTHSMRKTRGAILYQRGIDIALICKLLNHSNPSTTLRYIGITERHVQDTYSLEL